MQGLGFRSKQCVLMECGLDNGVEVEDNAAACM